MAFDLTKFSPLGASSARGKVPQMFSYTSGVDDLADIKGSGYFDEVANMLEAGDAIMFNDSAASAGIAFVTIAAITSGVVTMETADINSA